MNHVKSTRYCTCVEHPLNFVHAPPHTQTCILDMQRLRLSIASLHERGVGAEIVFVTGG